MLSRHQHCSAPFAADGDALHQAAQDQEDRRGDADAGIAWQQPDHRRCQPHAHQCEDQHRLTAQPIAEWLKMIAPIGRAKKPTPMVPIDRSVPVSGFVVGKKQLVEDERRRRAIDQKVIPFDRRADCACRHHRAHGNGVMVRLRRGTRVIFNLPHYTIAELCPDRSEGACARKTEPIRQTAAPPTSMMTGSIQNSGPSPR